MNRANTRKAYVSERICGNQRRIFSTSELIFYLALMMDIAFSVFYPVYTALHDYYTYIIWIMIILMLACGKILRYSGLKILGLVAFIGMNIAAILVNGSGVGVIILFICCILMNSSSLKIWI